MNRKKQKLFGIICLLLAGFLVYLNFFAVDIQTASYWIMPTTIIFLISFALFLLGFRSNI